MQQFFNNRYVRLGALTLGLTILFFLIIWLVVTAVGLDNFPIPLQIMLAVLGSGILVYKFFSQRVA